MSRETVNDGQILFALREELGSLPESGDVVVTFDTFRRALYCGLDVESERTVRRCWKRMIPEGSLVLKERCTCVLSVQALMNSRIRPFRFAVRECMNHHSGGFSLNDVMDSGAPSEHSAMRVLDDFCSRGLLIMTREDGRRVFKPI